MNNSTPLEQLLNLIENHETKAKSILPTHIYMTAHFPGLVLALLLNKLVG